MIPTYCLTNNNHLWLTPGFIYLWRKYTRNYPITIVGFDQQPDNVNFLSLGKQLPASQWSNGLIKMCSIIPYSYFILMLEDYWLYDYANINQANGLLRYMSDDVLRIDLSGNRLVYPHQKLDNGLVETFEDAPYQMSFQAAVWNKKNLLKVLEKGENPWQSEINGSNRVGNLRVLGTQVLYYQPVWRSKQKRWQVDKLNKDDLNYIRSRGWMNERTITN